MESYAANRENTEHTDESHRLKEGKHQLIERKHELKEGSHQLIQIDYEETPGSCEAVHKCCQEVQRSYRE
jgi:hypothetical protein